MTIGSLPQLINLQHNPTPTAQETWKQGLKGKKVCKGPKPRTPYAR